MKAYQKKSHTHNNQSALDEITAEKLRNGTMLPNMLIIRLKISKLKYKEICISIKIWEFLIPLQLNLFQNGITVLKSCRELK